jgi:3',5'-cyclic AMP phosphodiesterase CpdA
MTNGNREWETEMEYSRKAIRCINELNPRPVFCCVCGDLTDMEHTFYNKKEKYCNLFTKEECDEIQEKQRQDFHQVWSELHQDIALVCVCGNHDIGNRPTKASIDSFKSSFGDDYLAFWSSGHCYNIVLNTTLISDPSGAEDMYNAQLEWLEGRLKYARDRQAKPLFVFGHHPWFLYDENEDADEMKGFSPFEDLRFPDSYFIIPKERRSTFMDLFRQYQVDAYFGGHFHQNHVAESSFGMKLIITSSLSVVFESNGKPSGGDSTVREPSTRGMRVVKVAENGAFQHEFVSLPE